MSHFAKVVDRIVTKVIVAEPEYFDTFMDDSPGTWVQTYKDASQRGNYAGIGHKYDPELDAFIGKQPYPSWVLNRDHHWESPLGTRPEEGSHNWNEETKAWDEQ
jgi:hypothetical protein